MLSHRHARGIKSILKAGVLFNIALALGISQAGLHLPIQLRTPIAGSIHAGDQIPPPVVSYGTDVETWWASHPYNPESPNYIQIGHIASPPPVLDVQTQFGGNIQSAVDALPASGGTLYFRPGTYQNNLKLVGKSNVHFISDGGAIISGGPGQVVGCPQALDYATIAAEVHSRYPESIACITTNRIRNIYFKNIVFDGGGQAVNALMLRAANGVVFDQVTFQNFKDPQNYHHGLVNGTVDIDNIWLRGVHFAGNERWTIYMDGAHFSGVVQSQIDFNFGEAQSSSGGLLFMTNDDLNGDYNGNGLFEPNEKRNANYIVVAHNVFGASGETTMHTGIAITGANVLIKQNRVLKPLYRFVYLMGKCDAINPGVDMQYINLKVIANQIAGATIFAHVDGGKYDCEIQNNTMTVGKYAVKVNKIDSPNLSALVWETNTPLEPPNITEDNCVGGKLYGKGTACTMALPFQLFIPISVVDSTP